MQIEWGVWYGERSNQVEIVEEEIDEKGGDEACVQHYGE